MSVLYQIRRSVSSPNHGNQGIDWNPLDRHVGHLDAGVVVDLDESGVELFVVHFENGHGVMHAAIVVPLSELHWLECVLCLHVFLFVVSHITIIPNAGMLVNPEFVLFSIRLIGSGPMSGCVSECPPAAYQRGGLESPTTPCPPYCPLEPCHPL